MSKMADSTNVLEFRRRQGVADRIAARVTMSVLHKSGGGGTYDGMEARVARLESDVQHIAVDVREVRTDMREMRTDLSGIRERLASGEHSIGSLNQKTDAIDRKVDKLPGRLEPIAIALLIIAALGAFIVFSDQIRAFLKG